MSNDHGQWFQRRKVLTIKRAIQQCSFIKSLDRPLFTHPRSLLVILIKELSFNTLSRDFKLLEFEKPDSAQSTACCNVDLTHLVIFLTGYRSKFDRIFSYNFPFTDCFWSMCPICAKIKSCTNIHHNEPDEP